MTTLAPLTVKQCFTEGLTVRFVGVPSGDRALLVGHDLTVLGVTRTHFVAVADPHGGPQWVLEHEVLAPRSYAFFEGIPVVREMNAEGVAAEIMEHWGTICPHGQHFHDVAYQAARKAGHEPSYAARVSLGLCILGEIEMAQCVARCGVLLGS